MNVSGIHRPSAGYAADYPRADLAVKSDPVEPEANAASVKKLLDELFEVTNTPKDHKVKELTEKLEALRTRLGDEKFKEILDLLRQQAEASAEFLEFLRKLTKSMFGDDYVPSPGPSPSPSPSKGVCIHADAHTGIPRCAGAVPHQGQGHIHSFSDLGHLPATILCIKPLPWVQLKPFP